MITLDEHPKPAQSQRRASVRPAQADDAGAIADLLHILDYSATPQEVLLRLEQIARLPASLVAVAETDAGVVGMCQTQGVQRLCSEAYAEINTLVVGTQHQGYGIGRALLGSAIAWAREHHFRRIRLWSSTHRADAHGFYEAQGFDRVRTSHAFELTLDAPLPDLAHLYALGKPVSAATALSQ